MRVGFVLPSCNYNIVLSADDLKQLTETGYISMRPDRTAGTFKNDHGVTQNTTGHHLMYNDQYDENHVQFLGIVLENDPRK